MKIAVLGDTHFGVRNDSPIFHEYFKQFYENIFFPYLKQNNIQQVIQTGDLFDRRKFVNYNTLDDCRKYFFDKFWPGLNLITYLGNHDIYYKNTLELNSPSLLLQEYVDNEGIEIIDKPITKEFNGVLIDIIPWICEKNESDIKAFIANSKSSICFGHFEIAGFAMEKGSICYEGMNRDDLKKYEMVISGHFHHRSTDGHIFYVGSPCQHTWADYDDVRGFHVFDTKTRDLTFIPNTYIMFHKIIYDDTQETLESVQNHDFSPYYGKYVKVVVLKKTNTMLFDQFMSKLYESHPHDVGIVEDFTDYNTIDDIMGDGIDQSQETTTLIDRFIDGVEFGVDKEKLKIIMRQAYNDAQQLLV